MNSPADLFRRFEESARTGRILVRDTGRGIALTGPALREEVFSAVCLLRGAGIAPGDMVLLSEMGGIPLVTGIIAVWGCDGVALAADPQLAPAEVETLRETFRPRLLLREEAGRLRADLSKPPIRMSQAGSGHAGAGEPPEKPARILLSPPAMMEAPGRFTLPAGTAVIKITSGSTGRPRGIAVTAGQLLSDTEHILQGMGIDPGDLNIGVIPLSHSYGMDSLLMPLVAQGNPLLLAPPLPEPLSEALSANEPAVFPGIPCLFDLLGRPDGPSFAPRGLKTCISAGAPLRSATARAFRERFGLPIRAFYGCSETGGITYDSSAAGDAAESAGGGVGTPLPGVEVRLEGEEGRVVVRGANVASGYVGDAGDAEGAADGEFAEGAFRTGDTGRIDAAGRLHLTGRISSLVNVSGRKVNPREIEEAILLLPEVVDAAVLGIPDEARGESILACLVPEGEMTRDRIMSHLRERLAAYKLPRRILIMGEIPRNERGKLDRKELLLRAGRIGLR